MTPKEKAIELVNRFEKEVPTHRYNFGTYQTIVCALIAVDEIMKHNSFPTMDYWEEVKEEIEKL